MPCKHGLSDDAICSACLFERVQAAESPMVLCAEIAELKQVIARAERAETEAEDLRRKNQSLRDRMQQGRAKSHETQERVILEAGDVVHEMQQRAEAAEAALAEAQATVANRETLIKILQYDLAEAVDALRPLEAHLRGAAPFPEMGEILHSVLVPNGISELRWDHARNAARIVKGYDSLERMPDQGAEPLAAAHQQASQEALEEAAKLAMATPIGDNGPVDRDPGLFPSARARHHAIRIRDAIRALAAQEAPVGAKEATDGDTH